MAITRAHEVLPTYELVFQQFSTSRIRISRSQTRFSWGKPWKLKIKSIIKQCYYNIIARVSYKTLISCVGSEHCSEHCLFRTSVPNVLEEVWFWFLKVFLKRNVSETSKFGFYSSRTDGKRVHRSVGLHGAELWPFEVIRLLEEKWFQVFELFLKSNAILGFGIGFSMSESPPGTNFQPYWTEIRSNLEGWNEFINQYLGFNKSLRRVLQ